MHARRRWLLAIPALVGAVLLALWLWPEDLSSPSGDGATGGGFDDVTVLGGAGGARGGDPGEAGRARGGDAGLSASEWRPTASVVDDPGSPHGSLHGRVVSSRDGAPVAGAELVFLREGSSTTARSDAQGRFAAQVSEPGRYVLSVATAEGFLPYAPEWGHSAIAFEARPRQRIEGVVVQLRPERQIEVQVVDGDEAPVAGASVRVLGASSGERAMAPVREAYTTDAEGRATVTLWRWASIEARHPDHGLGRARARGADTIQITLRPARPEQTASESIAGRVVDTAGQPIEGALVTAFRRARGLHPSAQGATGADGAFELLGLDVGEHVLMARHPMHPDARVGPVQTGATDATLTMQSGLTIAGRVLDAEGQAVPAVHVSARGGETALTRRTMGAVVSYDADGRFLVSGLSEGEYELVATSRGMPPSDPVMATAGGPDVTLTLERGAQILGLVRDDEGAPIAGARVSIETGLGRRSATADPIAPTVTDADGAFVLDGVGSEPRSIRVTADGHHGRLVSGFTAASGATRRLEVTLSRVADGEEARTELVGIGVNVWPRGDALVVGRVVEGGSAEAAGLHRGDRILAVDGAPVEGLGFRPALERIRGTEGSTVVLTIQRAGEDAPAQLPIVRTRIRT